MRRLDANNKLLGKAGDAQIAQGASYSGALHVTMRDASSSEDLKKFSMVQHRSRQVLEHFVPDRDEDLQPAR